MLKALDFLRQPRAESVDEPDQPEDDGMSSVSVIRQVKLAEEMIVPGAPTTAMMIKAEEDTLEEIYTWVNRVPFSRKPKNIARDFSDGVLMAELLKQYYPRQVDLHNYISKNSIANKIDNWSTLNRKVLSKIGMKLGKDAIKRLAYSEPGVLESILGDLRIKILKDSNADRNSLFLDYADNGKGETVKSVLNTEELANKTVPRQAFVKLKHELREKKSVISALGEKVTHLESLMKLKDQRIADLTAQISRDKEKSDTPRSSIVGKHSIDKKTKAT